MHIERLIKMANDVSNFFAADPDKQLAIEGIKNHLARSWEPRMRHSIVAYTKADGAGLSELAKAAIAQL